MNLCPTFAVNHVESRQTTSSRRTAPFNRSTPAINPRTTSTILLVDDDESLRQMLQVFLSSMGYQVVEARNGKDALSQFKKRKSPIHLLFTDIEMPEMDGLQLAREIHTMDPQIKILLTSGNGEKYPDADSDNLMAKPYQLSALAKKIKECLGELNPHTHEFQS